MSRFERPAPVPALPGGLASVPRSRADLPPPAPTAESATRPRAGVICNPRSHLNRRAEIAGAVPAENAILAAPRTHGELAATLSEFAARGIDLLVIDGGDGTVRDVLSAAAEAFGDDLPQVAVLPTGKTNALALDLGLPAGWSLHDALEAARTGGIRRRAPIVITRAGSALAQRGFLFGAGAFVRASALAQRTHSVGAFNGFAVALAIVWGILQSLFGRATGEWRRGDAMRIALPGEDATECNRYFLMGSTLEHLPLGVRPLGPRRPGLKLLNVDSPARRLLFAVVPILFGRTGGWLARNGYRHADVTTMSLTLDADYILDGEVYPGGALSVAAGTPIAFVVP
ncbi:MAG: diacylglycerol kinase family protein [Pseudomonadota bacterium]